MDLITTCSGLPHIAEEIFLNLQRNDLSKCQEVNENWASILKNPWFWYNRIKQNYRLSTVNILTHKSGQSNFLI